MKKKKNAKENVAVQLTSFIDAVRQELTNRFRNRGDGFDPLFQIKGATVEANVTAKKDVKAQLGVSFQLAKAGVTGTKSTGSTFKIAINLEPIDDKDPRTFTGS